MTTTTYYATIQSSTRTVYGIGTTLGEAEHDADRNGATGCSCEDGDPDCTHVYGEGLATVPCTPAAAAYVREHGGAPSEHLTVSHDGVCLRAEETLTVTAGEASKTATGVERGLDVGVTVTLPGGRVVEGEVTLLPAEDGRPVYESWGEPSMWVSGKLLAEVSRAYDGDEFRAALRAIASAAARRCGRPEDA